MNKKNDTECHTTLNWKNFECELCKLSYPYTFMLKGKRWNLVDLKRPKDLKTPYIILESLNSEKNSSRTIHTVIINTERTAFSLGRGHDSDLRINDISVSRKHANLEYKNGKFYFVDLKSKFGTLALLSHDIELVEQNSQTFQIGRTVVTLKAKATQPWKNKDKSGNAIESMLKGGQFAKDKFLKTSANLVQNHANSPNSANEGIDDKIQNFVPVFETNKSKKVVENLEDGQHQIIEIDGKRYLVIQELDTDKNAEIDDLRDEDED